MEAIPIVFKRTSCDEMFRKRALEMGAQAYLTKPTTTVTFLVLLMSSDSVKCYREFNTIPLVPFPAHAFHVSQG